MKFYRQGDTSLNGVAAIINLFRYLEIAVPVEEVKRRLTQHPEYPSLLSLSDYLEECRVMNLATTLDADQLSKIPLPAIAHLHRNNGHYILLLGEDDGIVRYIDPEAGFREEPLQDFNNKWSGNALLIEVNDKTEETIARKFSKKKSPQNTVLSLGFITMLLCFLFNALLSGFLSGSLVIILMLKCAGLVVGLSLVAKQFNVPNAFAGKVCDVSQQFNCTDVIHSPFAKLSFISMSEVVMLYFASGLLSLLLCSTMRDLHAAISLLYVLNIFSLLPVSVSIYLQGVTLRKWCILCLTISCVLLFEFGILLYHETSFVFQFSYPFIAGFLLPSMLWFAARQALIKSLQVESLEESLAKFKMHAPVINCLLREQPPLQMISCEYEIVLGNKSADYTVTMITDPFCSACVNGFSIAKKVIAEFGDDIKIVVRFYSGEPDNKNFLDVVNIFIANALLRQHDNLVLMSLWYDSKDVNKFINKHGSLQIPDGTDQKILQQHLHWCMEQNLTATPSFVINGKKLPQQLDYMDLPIIVRATLHDQ
jgi:uncharacterized membrane protein